MVGLGSPQHGASGRPRSRSRNWWSPGTFRYANCYPAAIALAASGAVDLDGLVTAKFGLEQVAEALSASKTDPHTLKPMVYPGVARI